MLPYIFQGSFFSVTNILNLLLCQRKWKNDAHMAISDCNRARRIDTSSFKALFYMSEALLQVIWLISVIQLNLMIISINDSCQMGTLEFCPWLDCYGCFFYLSLKPSCLIFSFFNLNNGVWLSTEKSCSSSELDVLLDLLLFVSCLALGFNLFVLSYFLCLVKLK